MNHEEEFKRRKLELNLLHNRTKVMSEVIGWYPARPFNVPIKDPRGKRIDWEHKLNSLNEEYEKREMKYGLVLEKYNRV